MAWINKRTPDWWFFTFLPLLVFGVVSFLLYVDKVPDLLLLLNQQLYFYSLILSSTEIGLRYKLKAYVEDNKFKNSWFGFLLLILSAMLLIITYVKITTFQTYPLLFTAVAVIVTLGSIWLSNQNYHSGIPDVEGLRRSQESNFSQTVENSQNAYKEVKV